MRTLIVSDLHLGQRPGHDVLRRPGPLARLLAAVDATDRLVLLGDVVELGSRVSGRRALEVAAPVLGAICEHVGEREIVLVPGNHDAAMARTWARARGTALGLADDVPAGATPELAAVLELLGVPGPAGTRARGRGRVRVSYPGTWVGDRVWATHGHYLDRHLVPETTFGLPRVRDRGGAPGSARAADYELARRRRRRQRSDGFWARVRERPLAMTLELAAELTRYGTGVMRTLHLTPLTTRLIDMQMRHAALPAMAEVARRLGVEAEHVVFGHVHRLGPLPGERWGPGPAGGRGAVGPALLNTGSWVYEPLLLDDAVAPHPYWPGGAVIVDGDGPPRAVGLLDDLTRAELLGR